MGKFEFSKLFMSETTHKLRLNKEQVITALNQYLESQGIEVPEGEFNYFMVGFVSGSLDILIGPTPDNAQK